MYVQNVLDQFELKLIQILLRPEKNKRTVVWPSVGMIITSNGRSQQTPSAKGGKGKIQRLDWVSCPDTEIQVLPNLGIAVDRVSCPDTNIGVLTTRFPLASCFKETHAFCSKNMGVHVQCTCAKKLVSSNFAKIMHNYVWRKKNAQSSGRQWEYLGGFHILHVQNVLDQFELKLIQILLRPEKKNVQLYGHR